VAENDLALIVVENPTDPDASAQRQTALESHVKRMAARRDELKYVTTSSIPLDALRHKYDRVGVKRGVVEVLLPLRRRLDHRGLHDGVRSTIC
jgi:hypothetical protein